MLDYFAWLYTWGGYSSVHWLRTGGMGLIDWRVWDDVASVFRRGLDRTEWGLDRIIGTNVFPAWQSGKESCRGDVLVLVLPDTGGMLTFSCKEVDWHERYTDTTYYIYIEKENLLTWRTLEESEALDFTPHTVCWNRWHSSFPSKECPNYKAS